MLSRRSSPRENPQRSSSPLTASIAAFPDSALHHLFGCVCAGCPPTSPGICQLSLVCTRWRGLSEGVTGLRVLFQRRGQQHVAGFCAWVARHAPQMQALALVQAVPAQPILDSLREAAQAAAAGASPLPLTRLVILHSWSLCAYACKQTLAPLLAALPRLQNLQLDLVGEACTVSTAGVLLVGEQSEGGPDAAVLSALAPLRDLTSLTRLGLDVNTHGAGVLSAMPSSLRSLSWYNSQLVNPEPMCFDHLVNLQMLTLDVHAARRVSSNPLSSLQQLQHLCAWRFPWPVGAAQQHAVQLTSWYPRPAEVVDLQQLRCLTALRVLRADRLAPGQVLPVLRAATQLTQLALSFAGEDAQGEEVAAAAAEAATAGPTQVLVQCQALTGLRSLVLRVDKEAGTGMAPQLQGLTNLRELYLELDDPSPAWAAPLAGLVNMEVLSIPLPLAAAPTPWLTCLTKLFVLELAVMLDRQQGDLPAAAAQVGQLLLLGSGGGTVGGAGAGGMMDGGGCGGAGGAGGDGDAVVSSAGLQLVCWFEDVSGSVPVGEEPFMHMQRLVRVAAPGASMPYWLQGSMDCVMECGVELWPAPLAARLQQLW